MSMMRSGNPTLNENTFSDAARMLREAGGVPSSKMTIDGTVNRTFILLLLCLLTASVTWAQFFAGRPVNGLMLVGVIGGLISALVTIFKRDAAPYSAPAYALFEGLALGGVSAVFERQFPGIVVQAVALTFGTLFALLSAYKSRLIHPSENFKLGIVAATGGIFVVYLIDFVLGFFGASVSYIHGSGLISIGFSMFVVVIAALNLVLDFDFIENAAARGAPKVLEWYGAFGLMVTLIWLYLEILHLLAKLNRRR